RGQGHRHTRPYVARSYGNPGVHALLGCLRSALGGLGEPEEVAKYPEDMPVVCDPQDLPSHLEALLRTSAFQRDAGYASSFLIRVKGLLGDLRHQPIIAPDGDETLAEWLSKFLGDEE